MAGSKEVLTGAQSGLSSPACSMAPLLLALMAALAMARVLEADVLDTDSSGKQRHLVSGVLGVLPWEWTRRRESPRPEARD